MKRAKSIYLPLLAVLLLPMVANATLLFQEDFESDLSQWQGNNPSFAAIVLDPLDPLNHVLSFTGARGGGDIFSSGASFDPANDTFILSFRYLGTCGNSDCGGYVGYSDDFPGVHTWHYATGTVSGAADVLIDDGTWHSYSFTFNSARAVHLMLEDFVDPGNNVFFDDFRLADAIAVPEPGTLALLGLGLVGMAARRRKKA